jgi:hypothetical protein
VRAKSGDDPDGDENGGGKTDPKSILVGGPDLRRERRREGGREGGDKR